MGNESRQYGDGSDPCSVMLHGKWAVGAVGSVLKWVCSVLRTICMALREIRIVGTAIGVAVREGGSSSIRYKGVYQVVVRWIVSRIIVEYERAVKTAMCEGPIVGWGSYDLLCSTRHEYE